MSVPTVKQYELLRVLGNGCALIVGPRRRVEPLLRRGWVTFESVASDGSYTFVRATPAGLRALADAVEKYGWPPIFPERATQ